jgi:hypothetical protein
MKVMQNLFLVSMVAVSLLIVGVVISTASSGNPVTKIQFEGHEYIVLNRSGSICHNANCKKCNPQETVVIPFR